MMARMNRFRQLLRALLLFALFGASAACNDSDSVEYKFVSNPDGDPGGTVVVINNPIQLNEPSPDAGDTATPGFATHAAPLKQQASFTETSFDPDVGSEAWQVRRDAALAASRIFAGGGPLAELILGADGAYSGFVFNGRVDGQLDVAGAGNFSGRWQRDGETLLFLPRAEERELVVSFTNATGLFTRQGLIVETREGEHVLNTVEASTWPTWSGLGE